MNRAPATYTQPKLASLYRELEDRLNRLPGVEGSGLALYNPLTDNWGELVLVAGHPPPSGQPGRRILGSGERELPATPRRRDGARAATSPRPTTRPPRRSRSSTKPW